MTPGRPLKILIGADTFAPDINGAARFAERLAAGLVQRGHDVHVVAPNTAYRRSATHTEIIEGEPLTMHRLPAVRWLPHDWLRFVWPWRSKHYARKVLDEVQPDVVHIQSHIVIGRGLTRIAHQRGIPVIATNHVMAENILDHTTMPDFLNRPILKLAWDDAKRTFDMTRAVTTPTRKAADFLEHTIDIKGVVPISCGIDRRNYTPVIGPREQNRILFVQRDYSETELLEAGNFFNMHFAGKSFNVVRQTLSTELAQLREDISRLMQAAVEASAEAAEDGDAMVISGERKLLDVTDIASDMDRLRKMFSLFEKKTDLLQLLDVSSRAQGVQIYIGGDSQLVPMEEVPVITAPYGVDGQVIGTLGVIGPSRMAYDRVIPIVDITARMLSNALGQASS